MIKYGEVSLKAGDKYLKARKKTTLGVYLCAGERENKTTLLGST